MWEYETIGGNNIWSELDNEDVWVEISISDFGICSWKQSSSDLRGRISRNGGCQSHPVWNFESHQHGQETTSESRKLDCIYDDEPLGFEKYPLTYTKRMQAQDLVEEVDLQDGSTKKPTYISSKLNPVLK